MIPRPGQVVHIGPDCGVPYTFRPIHFAVREVTAHQHLADGAWLIGYEVDERGQATEEREIYVGQLSGLRLIPRATPEQRARIARFVPRPRARTAPATTTSGRTR